MEKINIAELLKDCPTGMELDCTMYENCTFEGIDDVGYTEILVKTPSGQIRLTTEGCFTHNDKYAKCVIFPKGKTTWEGFKRPFKDGDIVATSDGLWIGITTGGEINSFIPTYCVIKHNGEFEAYLDKKQTWQFNRLATEEEKQKLFQAIKDNGYKWNEETKTLSKLVQHNFEVGNKIEKCGYRFTIAEVKDDYYLTKCGNKIPIDNQDDFSLVPNKFDVTTLKPFQKVLVRDSDKEYWSINLFSFYNEITKQFHCMGNSNIGWNECIPYEGNEHLLRTTDDCNEYFKTW